MAAAVKAHAISHCMFFFTPYGRPLWIKELLMFTKQFHAINIFHSEVLFYPCEPVHLARMPANTSPYMPSQPSHACYQQACLHCHCPSSKPNPSTCLQPPINSPKVVSANHCKTAASKLADQKQEIQHFPVTLMSRLAGIAPEPTAMHHQKHSSKHQKSASTSLLL